MSVETDLPRRVVRLEATGVLGEHKHAVEFQDPDDFVIVFGPNGVGKTRFLEVVEALATLRVDLLSTLPFESATIEFSDNTVLAVRHSEVDLPEDSEAALFGWELPASGRQSRSRRSRDEKLISVPALVFTLGTSEGETATATVPVVGSTERDSLPIGIRRERLPPHLRREFDRILERSGSMAEARAFLRHLDRSSTWKHSFSEEFTSLAGSLDVRLIATQRLLTIEIDAGSPASRKETGSPRPTIEQYSDTVRERLETDLSENSRLSQRLDSIFPRLMLARREQSDMSAETIRERLDDQSKRRARIQQITPLGIQHELPLPDGELTSAQRSVLELYAEHAEQKLATFADTVQKIDLLEQTVNSRLYGKQLHINAEEGIIIVRQSDDERIPLASLSSGEQHEIILMFDLLFNVKKGGLVLIDEPEISLHIAWQKRFIPDVLQIAKLVGFQFVIATHSPQIIDKNWRFAQRLGPSTAQFDEVDEDA